MCFVKMPHCGPVFQHFLALAPDPGASVTFSAGGPALIRHPMQWRRRSAGTAAPLRFLVAMASHHAASRRPPSAESLRKQLPLQGAQLLPQPPVFHTEAVRLHPSCIYLPCLPFGLCAGMRRYGRLGPHAALQSLSVSRSHCSGYPPCPAKCLARCPMAKRRSSCPSGSFW